MGVSGSNPSLSEGRPSSLPFQDESAKRQILLVEDNQADIFLIKEAIELAGVSADVHIVRNGWEAVRFLKAVDENGDTPCPDLVLLDINLPRMSGVEVLNHLRNCTRIGNTKVLVVTSSDSARDRQLFSGLGAKGYFRKPSAYKDFMKLGPIVRELL